MRTSSLVSKASKVSIKIEPLTSVDDKTLDRLASVEDKNEISINKFLKSESGSRLATRCEPTAGNEQLVNVTNQLEPIYLLNELGSHNYELINVSNASDLNLTTNLTAVTCNQTNLNSTNATDLHTPINATQPASSQPASNQDQLAFLKTITNEPDVFKLTYALLTKSNSKGMYHTTIVHIVQCTISTWLCNYTV